MTPAILRRPGMSPVDDSATQQMAPVTPPLWEQSAHVDPHHALTAPLMAPAPPSMAPVPNSLMADGPESVNVTSQRKMDEEQLHNKMTAHENPQKPQGFGHKLLHGLAMAGNIAGDIFAPGTMALIPGTQLHNDLEYQQNAAQLGKMQEQDSHDTENAVANTEKLAHAQREQAQAESEAHPAPESPQYDIKETVDESGNPVYAAINKKNPADVHMIPTLKVPQKPVTPHEPNAIEELRRRLLTETDPTKRKAIQQQLKDMNPQAEQQFNFHVSEAANRASNAGNANTEREYTYQRNKWDKDLQTYNTQNERLGEAAGFIGQGAMGSALASIKALSGLAAGQGSGVRITQAELNSIAHSRGLGGDFEAAMQRFGDGNRLTPEQQNTLRGILTDVQNRAGKKQRVINQVLDDLSNASDSKTIRRIDSQARHALMGGQ